MQQFATASVAVPLAKVPGHATQKSRDRPACQPGRSLLYCLFYPVALALRPLVLALAGDAHPVDRDGGRVEEPEHPLGAIAEADELVF